MVKKSIKISCPGGLEPRPIAELVQVASNGDLLTVSADGNDEEGAMNEIQDFLKCKLNLVS